MRAGHVRYISLGDADGSNFTLRYLPMMVGRLLLSIRKAAALDTSKGGWLLTSISNTSHPGHRTSRRPHEMQFAQPLTSDGGTELSAEEDIPLTAVSSTGPILVSENAHTSSAVH